MGAVQVGPVDTVAFIRSASAWTPGEPPRSLDDPTGAAAGAVRWYDLDPAAADP